MLWYFEVRWINLFCFHTTGWKMKWEWGRKRKRIGRAFNGGLVKQCPKLGWLHFSGDSFFSNTWNVRKMAWKIDISEKKRSLFRRLLWAKRTCARLLLFFSLALSCAIFYFCSTISKSTHRVQYIRYIFFFFPLFHPNIHGLYAYFFPRSYHSYISILVCYIVMSVNNVEIN